MSFKLFFIHPSIHPSQPVKIMRIPTGSNKEKVMKELTCTESSHGKNKIKLK
jgi:hypothetical protein